ncbi:MAG TPA: hypothetical protein PKY85_02570, partial [Nitrosomonas sp.]|nr:hypothetical protein [Nitrosomonas sp.]
MHDLPWLLKSADDFNERCARLLNHASPDAEAQLLANYALSINQSNRLYQTLQKFDPEKRAIFSRNLIPFKLGIVSNATMDLMIPAMITAALRYGIELEVIRADFGQVAQEAFDPASKLNQSNLDAVLLALDYRAYSVLVNEPEYSGGNDPGLDALGYLQQIQQSFALNGKTICIVQTLAHPPYE